MGRRFLRLALIVGIVGAALVPVASAANEVSVSIGQPDLSARVAVTVPVTVSCPAFDASLTMFSASVFVNVEQAAGGDIAYGSGGVSAFGPSNLPFACDGSPHTVSVTVLANSAGSPFHGGAAVFSAFVSASAGVPCFPGSTNCFFNISSQSGSSGTTTIRMH